MRRHRLLRTDERGSALVGSILGMVFILVLTVGAVEVALALYARNVVVSAVHEGARAAVELGRHPADARSIARSRVLSAAGGLLEDLRLDARLLTSADGVARSTVAIVASIRVPGPVPLLLPVKVAGSASGQREVP